MEPAESRPCFVRRDHMDLIPVVFLQPSAPGNDHFRLDRKIVFQQPEHPPGQGGVFRREVDAHLPAAEGNCPADPQQPEQLRLFTVVVFSF